MGKFMKFGVVAALTLSAAGAFASNFRVADQVYVPAAGHITSGKTFITDVFISNVEDDAVDVSVIFSDAGGTTGTNFQSKRNLFTLQPRERKEIVDFVGAPTSSGGLGLTQVLGQLIFNACKSGADCTPDPTTGLNANFRNISVETRIYSIDIGANPATAPSTGQLFSGLPWYSFVSSDASAAGLDKVFITGLRNTGGAGTAGTYRSNIGLVNASQFSTTQLVIKLFDGKTGNQIGNTATVTLGPLATAQTGIAALFSTFTGATATNAYVTVEQNSGATVPTTDATANGCPNGCPAFFAYGSVLDNSTGDATTLEPQYLKRLTDTAINCIYNQTCKGAPTVIHRAVAH